MGYEYEIHFLVQQTADRLNPNYKTAYNLYMFHYLGKWYYNKQKTPWEIPCETII